MFLVRLEGIGMLHLIHYIKNNPNWEIDLTKKPHCLTVKRDDDFILFSYSQIESDFYNPIVREARGIILNADFSPVCVPFYKFGNYGEGYADKIDWNTVVVQEKVDGSLIKVWNYKSEWHVSTNGTIDAKKCELPTDVAGYKTFYDLFRVAAENSGLDISLLDPDYTYMFELISPYNRVVVPYKEIKLIHIGARNIKTLEECNLDIGIEKPKVYAMKSLEDCIQLAKELPYDQEGYVVVDKDWRRIKIKSAAYVAIHHLKCNLITSARIIELIRTNESDEFVTYFPEYTDIFNSYKNRINDFIESFDNTTDALKDRVFADRKEFANFALATKCPAFYFNWYDGKLSSMKEWLWNQSNDRILKLIGE